jgi:hypothetical protein
LDLECELETNRTKKTTGFCIEDKFLEPFYRLPKKIPIFKKPQKDVTGDSQWEQIQYSDAKTPFGYHNREEKKRNAREYRQAL